MINLLSNSVFNANLFTDNYFNNVNNASGHISSVTVELLDNDGSFLLDNTGNQLIDNTG